MKLTFLRHKKSCRSNAYNDNWKDELLKLSVISIKSLFAAKGVIFQPKMAFALPAFIYYGLKLGKFGYNWFYLVVATTTRSAQSNKS